MKIRYIAFRVSYWTYCKLISILTSMIESLERGNIGKAIDKIGEPYEYKQW